MPPAVTSRLRETLLCGLLVAALGACRGVTIAPDDASWTVIGTGRDAEATWRTGTVEVAVPLELRGDATMVTGSVRNGGSGVARVSFAMPVEGDRRRTLGTVSGERPDGGHWQATLVPGQEFDVPAGTPGAPGTVDFALRPDRPWTAQEAPEIESTITWEITVAAASAEAVCPLLFHVTESSPGLVNDQNTAVVVTLVALAGLIVWASYL
jgi:hypothetical protein